MYLFFFIKICRREKFSKSDVLETDLTCLFIQEHRLDLKPQCIIFSLWQPLPLISSPHASDSPVSDSICISISVPHPSKKHFKTVYQPHTISSPHGTIGYHSSCPLIRIFKQICSVIFVSSDISDLLYNPNSFCMRYNMLPCYKDCFLKTPFFHCTVLSKRADTNCFQIPLRSRTQKKQAFYQTLLHKLFKSIVCCLCPIYIQNRIHRLPALHSVRLPLHPPSQTYLLLFQSPCGAFEAYTLSPHGGHRETKQLIMP